MHPDVEVVHTLPPNFVPGADLRLEVEVRGEDVAAVRDLTVRYRPLNHSLAFATESMKRVGR